MYKNLLPFSCEPLIGLGIKKLKEARLIDKIIVSTESELIARIAYDYGATILQRPTRLAEDNIPSIPVFQHILEHYPAEVHVNYNINFPLCEPTVIDRGIELALTHEEALSVPYAVWAQTAKALHNYGNPWNITAFRFEDDRTGTIDIHTEKDLLETYRLTQGVLPNWESELTPKILTPS